MAATSPISGAAAIVGIGATEFSKNAGRSELQLACEAVVAALADAVLDPSEVDGLSTYTAETNGEILVARNTGIGELNSFSRIPYGGGAACGTVQQAAMAVATGIGVNGIAEAVRVLRGTSTNQPDAVENALVTAGNAVPTSGLIVGLCQ